jgi:MFS family permease
MSIGYTIGPTIGSALYEFGGFSLPFLVLGLLILLSAIASILLIIFANKVDKNSPKLIEEQQNNNGKKNVSLLRILRIPEVSLCLLSVFAVEFALFFYDASLTEHLMPVGSYSQSGLGGYFTVQYLHHSFANSSTRKQPISESNRKFAVSYPLQFGHLRFHESEKNN